MSSDRAVPLLDFLRQHHVLSPAQLRDLDTDASPSGLVNDLVGRKWLTSYQAAHLLQGKGRRLLVGPYIVLDRLGGGTLGRLYKARHRDLGRLAALKVLRRECRTDAQFVARFHQEVEVMARLDHPHIVRVYDVCHYGEQTVLILEHVEGPDLKQLVLRRGPLPVTRTCTYVSQVAAGLQHAYERGVVHRDLKPANLFLADGGLRVKIADFGLARLAHEASSGLTRTGMHLGTVDYMAPEQTADARTADVRADLYSLGCTFYFLLTGQPPFAGGSELSRLMRHVVEEPRPVGQLRPEAAGNVAAAVHRLLAKAPEDRYQVPAEVVAALAQVRMGSEKGGPAGPPREPGRSVAETDAVARYREPTQGEFAFVATESVTPRPHHLTARSRRRFCWEVAVAVVVGLLWSLVAVHLAWTR
jgi:serine/threonine protein kinase